MKDFYIKNEKINTSPININNDYNNNNNNNNIKTNETILNNIKDFQNIENDYKKYINNHKYTVNYGQIIQKI